MGHRNSDRRSYVVKVCVVSMVRPVKFQLSSLDVCGFSGADIGMNHAALEDILKLRQGRLIGFCKWLSIPMDNVKLLGNTFL